MTEKVLFSFWLLLALGTTTVLFNSCGKDDNPKEEGAKPKPPKPDVSLTTDTGVMINGIKWATRNVDKRGTFTVNSEDAGMFYQWNREKTWATTGDVTNWDATESESGAWVKTNDPIPAGWRVPDLEEFNTLFDAGKVTNKWVTQNGVNGRKFTDNTTGNSIFLPAAGYRIGGNGTLCSAGLDGYYWSSTRINSDGAWNLYFYGGGAYNCNHSRNNGQSVRCVEE